jgi:hypothetical protein
MGETDSRTIGGYQRVYLLSEDKRKIASIQKASLHSDEFGIALDHGLFGSGEWWAAIASGELPVQIVGGTICAMAMESMNDWPIFKILTIDGAVTESITRETFPGKAHLYQIGCRVIWKCVETLLKKDILVLPGPDRTTLEIWVGETVTLYRPIGPNELRLLVDSGYTQFPPRLPEQPIFYPVTAYRYAEEIASKWNVRDSGHGYVTSFDVDKQYLDGFDLHKVGNEGHQEYWIPAEELPAFNSHIVGNIQVVKSFHAFS